MNRSFYKYILYVSISLVSSPFYAERWVDPVSDSLTSYIYAPGTLGSEILMGLYCPKFIASTGEMITCSKGVEVIRVPARSCNFTEISLKKTKKAIKKARRTERAKKREPKKILIDLLMTPFRVMWYTASYISNIVFGLKIEKSKDKSGESLSRYWANPTKVSLAQEKDLAILKQTYNEFLAFLHKQDSRKKSVVLYGTSRGSAVIFNYTALEHPQEVKAVVCEGLFDSIEHVNTATRSSLVRWLTSMLPTVSQFNHQGIVPIKLIGQIPKDMPILLITSRNDMTVPCECTINIYNQLRDTGHDHVHILILQKAYHRFYAGCKEERELYKETVHAFYKRYGLPYIAEYADKGEEYFMAMTQPKICY